MDEKDRQTNWTTVVRRGKTQTKAKEKPPVKPPPNTSTTAGKRRVPLQPKCASTPKSKNKQQPKPQPKQRPKPPPTVPADVPSSEQWDFLWPSLSTLRQAPLRRTKTIKAPSHNTIEKHMTKISVRGISDCTEAGDSLPTEASDGENAAPKQQKPKTKTCSFRWGLKQQPEDQRSEPPAASEQVPEQTQSQQHLQPLQTRSPLQLVQPLEEEPLNFLSTRRSPTNTTAERLESAELYSVFQYPPNGTNAGELVQAMHFVLDVLERRRRLDDFMESTDIFGPTIPYINSNSDSNRDSHFRTDGAANNEKGPRVGEPEKWDDQKENDGDESVCRESVPRFCSERDEYSAYLVKLLNAFRLVVEKAKRIISGRIYHRVKAVEFLLMVAVAEKSDGRLPLPASLHDLPPQHLYHLRRLMEMEKLPAEYYLRKAAKFCRGTHGFMQEPHENYTHGENCSSTAGKEVQTTHQLPVLPASSPEAHSSQTRLREILLHRTVRLVHEGDTAEDQQNQLTPTDARVENNAQCTKSVCRQKLKTTRAEYQLLNRTPREGAAATPIQTSLQQPRQYTRVPTCDQRMVIRPPPPPDSTSWHTQPSWQYNSFPLPPMTILPTPQPNMVQPCKQNKESECGWSDASPLPSQWQLPNRENCQYFPMRGEANVSISQMRPSANFTEKPSPPHSCACRSEWQTNSMFKRVTDKPAYLPECQPLPTTFGACNYHPQEQQQEEWSNVPIPKEVDWSFEFTGDYLNRDVIVLPQEDQEQRPPNTNAQGTCFLPTGAGTNMEAEQRHPLFWPHQQLDRCNLKADNRRDWIACKGFFSVSTSSSDTQSCDSCELQEVEGSQLEGYRQAPTLHPSHYTSTSGLVVQDSHQRLAKRRRGKKQLQQLPQQHTTQQKQHQRLQQQQRQQQTKPNALPVQLHDIQVTEILQDIKVSYCVPPTFSNDPQNTKGTGEKETLTLSKTSEVEANCRHLNYTRTAATPEHVRCAGAIEIFTAKGSRKTMGTLPRFATNTSRKSRRNSSAIHREWIGRVNRKRNGREYSVFRFELSVA